MTATPVAGSAAATALILFLSSACDDPESQRDPAFAVSDSARIEIVTNRADAVAGAPNLVLAEDLRIGTTDGPPELQFYSIATAMESPSGEILVLDRGNNELRAFDQNGSFLYAFGREGDGPGEFRRPSRLAVAGDTILVADREISLFVDREHVLTTPTADPTLTLSLGWIGHGPNGWVGAVRKRGYPLGEQAGPGPFTDSVRIGPLDVRTGAIGESILELAVGERYLLGSAGWILGPLFARDLAWAVADDGRVYYTPGDDYVVSVLNPDGTARRRVIAEVEHIPVTPADMDEYLDRRRAAAGPSPVGEGAQFIDEVSALYPAVPMIPFRPIPGRIFPAPSGRFLVERVDLGPEPNEEWEGGTTWDLFDADGRIEGRITTPPSITFLRLTDEGLYTITRDELDVQHLVRYRLVVEGA